MAAFFGFLAVAFLAIGITGCGVKGDPIPYVDSYPAPAGPPAPPPAPGAPK